MVCHAAVVLWNYRLLDRDGPIDLRLASFFFVSNVNSDTYDLLVTLQLWLLILAHWMNHGFILLQLPLKVRVHLVYQKLPMRLKISIKPSMINLPPTCMLFALVWPV